MATPDDNVDQLMSMLDGPAMSGTQAGGDQSDNVDQLMSMLDDKPTAAPAPGSTKPAETPPNDKFVRAAQPKEPPTDDLSLKDALSQAGTNFLPSAEEKITQLPEAVKALPDLAKGIASKVSGWAGVQQDKNTKDNVEAVVNAVANHYKTTYGSWSGFKHELAKDPTSIMMDFSPVVSGGLGAAGEALDATSLTGKALSLASKATDPVSAATNAALAIPKGVNAAGKFLTSKTARVSQSALDTAQAAGKTANPVLKKAFADHLSGSGDPTDILDTLQSAGDQFTAAESKKFGDAKAVLSANQTSPRFGDIDQAISDARAQVRPGGINNPNVFPEANEGLDKMEGAISAFKQTPSQHNLEGFDALKRSLGNIWDGYKGNTAANKVLGGVYSQTRDAIGKVNPGYFDLMDQWKSSRNDINNVRSTAGLTSKDASAAVSKIIKKQGTGNGRQVLSQLAKYEPTLPYKLAGAELSPWTHSGGQGFLDLGLAGLAGFSGGSVLHGVGAMAAMSPRVMGGVQYGMGMTERGLSSVPAQAAKYATMQTDNALSDGGNDQQQQPSQQDADDTFSKMVQTESGGKQFDKNGKPLISRKGAVGAAQVLPSTAAETAKDMGIKFDPQRLLKDRNYNLSIGQHYYNMLRQKFGDPHVAAAAYNAGPGKVEDAQGKAASSGGSYLDHLSAETQQYVRNLMLPMGRASGGRVIDHKAEARKLVALADGGLKHQNKKTEDLLNLPDDAVAHALKIADRHI